MSDQLLLQWSAEDRDRERYEAMHLLIVEIVARTSLKEAAYRLDVSDKALGHALARRDRHYVRFDWLPGLAELALKCGLAAELGAALVEGLRLSVVDVQPLTPEQKLARYEAALSDMGEVGDLVRRKAGVGR